MKMKKLALIIPFVLLGTVLNAQTKTIAHRGFWDTEGSAQNSLKSLRLANDIHCFGSEFDVWITKDGEVIVNHDPVFQNVTLETATYNEVKNLRLSNGEKMPTLKEYLKAAKKLNVQLILEIKTHKDIERQNAAIDATLELVKKMKLENRITYIAFSIDAVKRLVKEAPKGTEVYYLNGELSPQELKAIGCTGPDYQQNVYKEHPEWIKECHELGLKTNVWTVNKKEDMEYFIKEGIDYITTNKPVVSQKLIGNKVDSKYSN